MLRFLSIKRLAVIDAVEVEFDAGGGEVVVRREITAQGRSRAFINGELVTAGALKDLSSQLVELHGQHEHQTLLDPATHLLLLDAFGALDEPRAATATAYERLHASAEALAQLRRTAADRGARQELAAFQLGELERASLGTLRATAASASGEPAG